MLTRHAPHVIGRRTGSRHTLAGAAAGSGGPATAQRSTSASFEEREHGEDAAVVVLVVLQRELLEDAVDVLLDGALGHPELARDTGVRASLGHQGEHLALSRAELVGRVLGPGGRHELLDE